MKRLLLPLALLSSQVLGPTTFDQLYLLHNNCVASSPFQEETKLYENWRDVADHMHRCVGDIHLSVNQVEQASEKLQQQSLSTTGFYLGALIDRVPELQRLHFDHTTVQFFGAGCERGNMQINHNQAPQCLYMSNGKNITIKLNSAECAFWPREEQPLGRYILEQDEEGGFHNKKNTRIDRTYTLIDVTNGNYEQH